LGNGLPIVGNGHFFRSSFARPAADDVSIISPKSESAFKRWGRSGQRRRLTTQDSDNPEPDKTRDSANPEQDKQNPEQDSSNTRAYLET